MKNQNVTTRGSKVRLREASLFVVCKPEADVNAVKAQIKALGAHLKGTIGRTIMVSAPVDKGFDYTHPAFKDKDNNLRIKAVYMPGVQGDEPIVTADGENLDGTLITDLCRRTGWNPYPCLYCRRYSPGGLSPPGWQHQPSGRSPWRLCRTSRQVWLHLD